MSEDCHSSDNVSPEEFERWKIGMQSEMLQAAKALRGMDLKPKRTKTHLGRWEELTMDDFKFLYAIGVSCE
jgi:hypothetical protein